MNKITKIGVLGLALGALAISLNTFATTGDVSKTVTLELTNGENTCHLLDYSLGTKSVATGDQQTNNDSKGVDCVFLNSNSNIISFQMSDLVNNSDSDSKITKDNFVGNISSVSTDGTLNSGTNKDNFNLGTVTGVYTKNAHTAGVWSANLAIQGTIPGGTPAGVYTGTINLTLQAN